jgi:hypothetical protein
MVFQFLVSAVLISGSLIINKQLNFIRAKELGFDKENVVLLPNVRGAANPESLVADLNKIPEVKSIGRADGVLAGENATNGVSARNPLHHISLNFMRTDDGFLPSLGIRVIEGRNFSGQFGTDTGAIILNETAVRELGLKPPFIGQQVIWDDDSAHDHSVTIIGIAKDFNFSSLQLHLIKNNGEARRISEISTGQRAALAISVFISLNRKLKNGPNIIMFDDPVSHIDDLNALPFLDFLRFFMLKEERQIFFATANTRLASLIEKKFIFLEGDFKQWDLKRELTE